MKIKTNGARRAKAIVERGKKLGAVFGGVAVLMGPVLAHQTFLLPESFVSPGIEPIDVILTSALAFPNVASGPTIDRIAYSYAAVDGEAVQEVKFRESEKALTLTFTPEHSGFAVIAASSKPRSGKIPPEDVGMYLEEIEADDKVREAFDALPGEPALHRSYSKHAKTYFCVAICDDHAQWALPVGQKLEFVTTANGRNSFQLLLDGKPLAGKQVTIALLDGETVGAPTDESGIVQVGDAISGVVMLSAVWITMPESPDGVYHSDYVTLTIDLDQLR